MLSVLGPNSGYTVKYIPSPSGAPSGFALGNSFRQRVYLTLYPPFRPSTDTVCMMQFEWRSLHGSVCIVQCAWFSVHCAKSPVQNASALCVVHFALGIVHGAVCMMQCAQQSLYSAL